MVQSVSVSLTHEVLSTYLVVLMALPLALPLASFPSNARSGVLPVLTGRVRTLPQGTTAPAVAARRIK